MDRKAMPVENVHVVQGRNWNAASLIGVECRTTPKMAVIQMESERANHKSNE